MSRSVSRLTILAVAISVISSFSTDAVAARSGHDLLPSTTAGYVSVPDMRLLREKWRQTQLGQLASDPVMKPFAEDLRRQLTDKMGQVVSRLGLTWEDLESVHSGEVCMAMLQPGGDVTKYATALLVDVSGREEATTKLLSKIESIMAQEGATKKTSKISDVSVTTYEIKPDERPASARQFLMFVHQGQLVVVDNQQEAVDIINRFSAGADETLGGTVAFVEVMNRCKKASGNLEPLARWFIRPLPYANAVRAATGIRRRRGTDSLKVLAEQGFDAMRGVGGHVNLMTDSHEIVYRAFAYAPPVERTDATNQDKYDLAFRMFDFPNGPRQKPQDWVPRDLASYASFNWKMKVAFEYSETLIDGFLGPGFFNDFLATLRDDINGPQIDIRKELVAHLGQRGTLLADHVLPVGPTSERILFALELTDAAAVSKNLDRALKTDPYAQKIDIHGHTVWEMLSDEEEETPTVLIDGIGLTPLPAGGNTGTVSSAGGEKKIISNSAIAVLHDQLVWTSHVELMKKIIIGQDKNGRLTEAIDFQMVQRALGEMGSDENCMRFFTRCDEAYRTTYEMLRQNRMPEAETVLGRILNRLLQPNEKGIRRQQMISGEKLPEFDIVSRYLGPGGMTVSSLDDGWFVSGVLLKKDQGTATDYESERPALTTASKDDPNANKE